MVWVVAIEMYIVLENVAGSIKVFVLHSVVVNCASVEVSAKFRVVSSIEEVKSLVALVSQFVVLTSVVNFVVFEPLAIGVAVTTLVVLIELYIVTDNVVVSMSVVVLSYGKVEILGVFPMVVKWARIEMSSEFRVGSSDVTKKVVNVCSKVVSL
jgi:hypothetical protein